MIKKFLEKVGPGVLLCVALVVLIGDWGEWVSGFVALVYIVYKLVQKIRGRCEY
jgi:hypothetical protein